MGFIFMGHTLRAAALLGLLLGAAVQKKFVVPLALERPADEHAGESAKKRRPPLTLAAALPDGLPSRPLASADRFAGKRTESVASPLTNVDPPQSANSPDLLSGFAAASLPRVDYAILPLLLTQNLDAERFDALRSMPARQPTGPPTPA